MHKTSTSAAKRKQSDTAKIIIHLCRSKYAKPRKLNAGEKKKMRASQGGGQNVVIKRKQNNIQTSLRQSALQPTNFQPKLFGIAQKQIDNSGEIGFIQKEQQRHRAKPLAVDVHECDERSGD